MSLGDFFTIEWFRMIIPNPLARLAFILYVVSYFVEWAIFFSIYEGDYGKIKKENIKSLFKKIQLVLIIVFVIGYIF